MEGKYWKRHLDTVTAEYKKWRIYHKNKAMGCENIHIATNDEVSHLTYTLNPVWFKWPYLVTSHWGIPISELLWVRYKALRAQLGLREVKIV